MEEFIVLSDVAVLVLSVEHAESIAKRLIARKGADNFIGILHWLSVFEILTYYCIFPHKNVALEDKYYTLVCIALLHLYLILLSLHVDGCL